jgi:hypothetical protein
MIPQRKFTSLKEFNDYCPEIHITAVLVALFETKNILALPSLGTRNWCRDLPLILNFDPLRVMFLRSDQIDFPHDKLDMSIVCKTFAKNEPGTILYWFMFESVVDMRTIVSYYFAYSFMDSA